MKVRFVSIKRKLLRWIFVDGWNGFKTKCAYDVSVWMERICAGEFPKGDNVQYREVAKQQFPEGDNV